MAGSENSSYDDSNFAPVTVPHTVTPLSWRNWNDRAWQQMWIYRRHFKGGQLVNSRGPGNRIMVDFNGVMVSATVVINDQTVSTHQGGYLPFSAELTGHVTAGDNLLSVLVDASCLPVPPMSLGHPANSIDFFQPGGIYRDVSLRVLPQAFLSDLFARPADVLTSQPRVDIELTIDSALPAHVIGKLTVELLDGRQADHRSGHFGQLGDAWHRDGQPEPDRAGADHAMVPGEPEAVHRAGHGGFSWCGQPHADQADRVP